MKGSSCFTSKVRSRKDTFSLSAHCVDFETRGNHKQTTADPYLSGVFDPDLLVNFEQDLIQSSSLSF